MGKILSRNSEYSDVRDRDRIAELRTLEEVINLPETLAEPLRKRYSAGKE